MFTREDLKKTRYYQQVREEVREELQQELREEVQQQVREELQQQVREELQQQVQEELQQLRKATLELIERWLQRFLGAVNPELQEHIHQLSVEQLKNLTEALPDFSNEADLATWLEENSN